MATIAFVPHHVRTEAADLAKTLIALLEDQGHVARVPAADARATGLDAWSCPEDELVEGLDLAVSLGGDGTMLHTIHLVARHGVPVLGVNIGHLGYLTEVEPDALEESLRRFLAGEYELEVRMTLQVALTRQGGAPVELHTALNEAVVERAPGSHVVRAEVSLGGRLFLSYAADALIVATPTGSTAYNLSVRGPIVSPQLAALVFTPVSPHQLFDRALVLAPEEDVRIEVLEGRPAELVCDGVSAGRLEAGDVVTCRRGAFDARIVTFARRDFHRILKAKFGLADR